MAPMSLKKLLPAGAGLLLAAFLVYRIPWVNSRLDWRLQVAGAYLRGVLHSIEPLPPPEVVVTPDLVPPTPRPTEPGPTPTPSPGPTPLPPSVQLAPPPFAYQGANNCGPATLSLYLHYYGWEGDQTDISSEVKPVNADKNVNPDELVYYVRNWAGWLGATYRVGGDVQLLKRLLAAGFPVMIEEGFYLDETYWPNDDRWAGHYLLVTGYDDAAGAFTVQDTFKGPDKQVRYADLESGWEQFNHVYLLLYLPDQEQTVRAILGEDWDEDANRQAALEAASAATQTDPQDAYAWFNLGMNQVYFEQWQAAAQAFDVARSIGLPQRMLRYQFGPFFAYYHANRDDDLNEIIDYALEITDDSEEVTIWKGWELYRQGDTNGAVEMFRKALDLNPKSVYAQQALDFMGASP